MKLKIITLLALLLTVGTALAASLAGPPFAGNFRMSSDFGKRDRPGAAFSQYHPAVDFATPIGTPMLSTINGTVSRVVQSNKGYGNFVTILSDNGNYSVQYAHLSASNVNVGDSVSAGQTIAASGNSGAGTDAHLDYKVSIKDPATGEMVPVDPVLAMGKDLDDEIVRAALVADSLAKLDGRRTTIVGDGTGTGTGAFSAIPPENTANFEGPVLGCDQNVMDKSQSIIDMRIQLVDEIVNSQISQPTPTEISTCLDQVTEQLNQTSIIHANPLDGISASMGPFVQGQMEGFVNDLNTSVSSVVNPISNAINATFNDVAGEFAGALGSLTPGSPPPSDCGMTEQMWLIQQCVQAPRIPDFVDIIDSKLAEIAGDAAALLNPDRYIEQVCNAVSSPINSLFSDVNNRIDGAADAFTSPITDGIDNISITN